MFQIHILFYPFMWNSDGKNMYLAYHVSLSGHHFQVANMSVWRNVDVYGWWGLNMMSMSCFQYFSIAVTTVNVKLNVSCKTDCSISIWGMKSGLSWNIGEMVLHFVSKCLNQTIITPGQVWLSQNIKHKIESPPHIINFHTVPNKDIVLGGCLVVKIVWVVFIFSS